MKIILFLFITMLISEEKYKAPAFKLIERQNNIEIRQYGEYIIAKTVIPIQKKVSENNMFKTLASYIFGSYEKNHSIGLKISLAFSTIFILFYFIYPSPLIEIVEKINII